MLKAVSLIQTNAATTAVAAETATGKSGHAPDASHYGHAQDDIYKSLEHGKDIRALNFAERLEIVHEYLVESKERELECIA